MRLRDDFKLMGIRNSAYVPQRRKPYEGRAQSRQKISPKKSMLLGKALIRFEFLKNRFGSYPTPVSDVRKGALPGASCRDRNGCFVALNRFQIFLQATTPRSHC